EDAEFLRRAYLDLTGRIPTAEQAVRFLEGEEPDRRQTPVEELLESENYGRHFGVIWSALIVKRGDGDRGLSTAECTKRLAGALAGRDGTLAVSEGGAAAGGRGLFGGGGGGPRASGAQIEIPDSFDPRKRTGRIVKAKFFLGEQPTLGDKGPYRPAFADWLVT